jgi:hypothetical protein
MHGQAAQVGDSSPGTSVVQPAADPDPLSIVLQDRESTMTISHPCRGSFIRQCLTLSEGHGLNVQKWMLIFNVLYSIQVKGAF